VNEAQAERRTDAEQRQQIAALAHRVCQLEAR
jgi:hypothetical protein